MRILLIVVLMFVCSGFAQTFEVAGINYTVLSTTDKTVKVTFKVPKYTGNITVPATVAYNSITYSVAEIGSQAFYYCSTLTSVTTPNSVTAIGDQAFAICNSLTSVAIGNSVKTIGIGAFSNCFGLASVTIPNSVTTIGDQAFGSCINLVSLTIPNSVTNIGNQAFSHCNNLVSIEVGTSNPNYSSFDGLLYNKDRAILIQCPGGKNGNFQIPNSVITIGEKAFAYCSKLTSITMFNSVTTIANNAFYDCSGLTSLTIGSLVTYIGSNAFSYCSGLASITSLAPTPPSLGVYVFEYVPTNIPLYVPSGSIAAYQVAAQWKNFNVTPVSIDDNTLSSKEFSLSPNYPNPFNPSTTITYSLSSPDLINLSVYNSKGETVQTLINGMQTAGTHNISFDGSKLNSGIYFYKLEANGKSMIHKMMLVK